MEDTNEQIRQYLSQLFEEMGLLNKDAEEIEVDSFQFLTTMIQIEEHYGIQMKSEDLQLDKLQKMEDYVALINEYV